MGAIGSMFSKSRDGWPRNDREYARAHVGCNVTTCPNGKCRATGECIDAPRVTAPPLVPDLPLAVRLRDEVWPPLPQMVAQRRAQLADEPRREAQAKDPRNG